ncbi:DUF7260 family protein [Halosimplex amylolyticum]|uniref:DUF7260 family protein n=1 Tax=Halosimplex amylolyticum TaxID=3396616 RepID=UPI003F566698
MSDAERKSALLADSLERYVLSPIETAEDIVSDEYDEVEAERRAFECFKQRVATFDTTAHGVTTLTTRTRIRDECSRAIQRIRNAFRETVMNVDHYDALYGESLDEHFAAELSNELASGLQQDAHSEFTYLYKSALLTATGQAITRRETVGDILKNEHDSLQASHDALRAVLSDLNGTHVPARFGTDFTATLDEVARTRQQTLSSRPESPRADGHDFCLYLYGNRDWTYPVLTALTRLRGAVNGVVT